jgi:hypothetical protein
MPKTSTPSLPEKNLENTNASAPEWLIRNLLGFSKSIEVKTGKLGKKIMVHKN